LEGTIKGHLAQLPCSEQGHLQLDQVVQSPVQPDLERFQGWGIDHLSVQTVKQHVSHRFPSLHSRLGRLEWPQQQGPTCLNTLGKINFKV